MVAAGLPHIRVHDLRHTTATVMLEAGIPPKVVQELLGHKTIATTLDTYSHVMPVLHGQAMRVLHTWLGESSPIPRTEVINLNVGTPAG